MRYPLSQVRNLHTVFRNFVNDLRDRGVSPNSQRPSIKRKPVHSTYSLQNLRNIYSPEFHKHAQDKKRPYAKIYDFRRTRDKLLRTTLLQWLVTFAIAVAIVGALRGYQRKTTINTDQKHVFNAVITGLAIFLGINLASSLRSYADLLRWRLLSCTWLSLEEFDLILSCANQRKVLQLLLTRQMKRKFPFVSKMQLLCVVWIVVNVAAQILVAMLGLVYSLDSASQKIVSRGPTTIVNLAAIRDVEDAKSDDTFGQQASAHAYGLQGEDIPVFATKDPMLASESRLQTIVTDPGYTSMTYRFTDYNPTDPTTYHMSSRTINVTATCKYYESWNITEAFFGTDTSPLPGSMFNYYLDNGSFTGLYVREWAYGATTYVADNDLYCGNRCTRIYAVQVNQFNNQSTPNEQLQIPTTSIFDCNNTVGEIKGATPDGQKYTLPPKDPARAIAGAAGWTGYVTPLGDGYYENLEYQLFSNDSYWSPTIQLTASGRFSAARYISQYSIAALAAMDRQGPNATIADGMQPQQALKVTVEWANAIALLAAIIVLQLVFLLLVVFQANKAVIKDDSFLAIAKLLAPTVMTLGEHGSVLRGDEIAHAVNHQKGGNYKIFYGAREVRDRDEEESAVGGSGSSHQGHRPSFGSTRSTLYGDTALRAEIIERGMGIYPKLKGAFGSGKYD
jgi:hypothetical protein